MNREGQLGVGIKTFVLVWLASACECVHTSKANHNHNHNHGCNGCNEHNLTPRGVISTNGGRRGIAVKRESIHRVRFRVDANVRVVYESPTGRERRVEEPYGLERVSIDEGGR